MYTPANVLGIVREVGTPLVGVAIVTLAERRNKALEATRLKLFHEGMPLLNAA